MRRVFAGVFTFLCLVRLSADEGMWLLPLIEQLNIDKMKGLGCELSSEDIYNINNSSLKDAIVIFGGGCTGEIVSENGLLFTNHHCGFDAIQSHSTVEHDYLIDGFWAMSHKEELPTPDLEVRFLLSIEDVSDSVLFEISDTITISERELLIEKAIDKIEDEASAEDKYEAVVNAYFEGNKYYLCLYEVYKDVRFVGAPPSSIGKFGYDSDNWEWPRQTGDFSIFRVYTAPDGTPAEYSEENIPLKPKYFLPISLEGVSEGDYTMILGFPGNTDRYLSSSGIKEIMEIDNANRIKIRGTRQKILMEDMMNDPKIRIQYASKYSHSSNYWKYSIGQNKGLQRLDVLEKKRQKEKEFQVWADSDSIRSIKYGNLLGDIENLIEQQRPYRYNLNFLYEAIIIASEAIDFSRDFINLSNILSADLKNSEDLQNETNLLKEAAADFFKNYSKKTDQKVVKAMIKLCRENLPENEQPDFFKQIDKKTKGDIDIFVDKMFEKTIFSNEEKTMLFLNKPSIKVLQKDPVFVVMSSVRNEYRKAFYKYDSIRTQINELQRLYLEGIFTMDSSVNLYPDANFTMRLTYGTVKGYIPGDAVTYRYYTTLDGVMEKEDALNYEYIVPDKLKELHRSKDYDNYDQSDTMRVCFITNNDITGGNSGSPVLNSRGELIGLAFDGNWEAMSGDIAFEPELQRCICVDIRYVLFIIDKFAGAKNLIDELKIIQSN